jgi:hypothetical protein
MKTRLGRLDPFWRNLAILALVALAVVILNQEVALSVAGALVRVAFFIAIAVVAYFFWRDFGRREISIWPGRAQAVFYAAIALLVVDLGVWFTQSPSGRDALAFIVVGAAACFAGVRTWLEQKRLS